MQNVHGLWDRVCWTYYTYIQLNFQSTVKHSFFMKPYFHVNPTLIILGDLIFKWDLSKPPQRRQGHDPRLFWLLVGTLLVIEAALASKWAEHSLLKRMSLYTFYILHFHLICLCNDFYGLSALVGCLSLVFISRIIYKFLNECPFDYTAFAVNWKVGIPLTGLTRPVGWLSLLQLALLSRSAIVV